MRCAAQFDYFAIYAKLGSAAIYEELRLNDLWPMVVYFGGDDKVMPHDFVAECLRSDGGNFEDRKVLILIPDENAPCQSADCAIFDKTIKCLIDCRSHTID